MSKLRRLSSAAVPDPLSAFARIGVYMARLLMNGAFFEKSAPFKSILTSVRLYLSRHLSSRIEPESCNRQREGQTDRLTGRLL